MMETCAANQKARNPAMTEFPPVSPAPVLSPAPEFKDRRGGLIVFGILLLIAGGICALCVPLMLLGMVASKANGAALDLRMMIPGMVMYGVLAVVFVCLGIGSIMARRWARALVLILAWLWLVTGVLVTGVMAVVMPKILAAAPSAGGQPLPAAARAVAMVVALGFTGFILVLVPGVLVLFYGRRNVKATCEARDPKPRWTDACPLPVLALSLFQGFSAAAWLVMVLPVSHTVVPFFGCLLSGAPAIAVGLVVSAFLSYGAWAMYRLKPVGWWITLIGVAVMTASSLLTFSRVDMVEMYRQMGTSEQQIQQLQQYNFFQGHNMLLFIALYMLPVLGYVLCVKRYFRSRS